MDLCICDIDGILAVNLEREIRAQQFADSRFVREEGIIPSVVYRDAWLKIFYSERAFYNPELVPLDIPIEGINEQLLDIQAAGYKLIFLTSRPESLRQATINWLLSHTVYDGDDTLIMKASAFQFTKTTVWKAGMVQMLSTLYDAGEIIFVDDEQANIDALIEHGSLEGTLHVWGYKHLADAAKHAQYPN